MATVGRPHDDEGSGSDNQWVELEEGGLIGEVNVTTTMQEKNCRICLLSLDTGISIQLGCSCKDDLGVAHKQCAEEWFKRKFSTTCEICGESARNVVLPYSCCYCCYSVIRSRYFTYFAIFLAISVTFLVTFFGFSLAIFKIFWPKASSSLFS